MAIDIAFRHLDLLVCQRGAADGLHVRLDDQMLLDTVVRGNLLGALKLDAVALVVVEADRVYVIPLALGHGHARAAVEAARK